jgi:hypothetical protein
MDCIVGSLKIKMAISLRKIPVFPDLEAGELGSVRDLAVFACRLRRDDFEMGEVFLKILGIAGD